MPTPNEKLKAIDTAQDDFPMCFACGKDNPVGLKLKFHQGKDEATSEFTVGKEYQGWGNIVHGGILCTILDEAIAYTHFPDIKAVSVETTVRFRHPAPCGVPMAVHARLTKKTKRLLTATATITLKDGTVIAECTGQSYVVNT
ncbi:PaaI family thioesterase [Chloroflexota bacterium]